MFKSLLISCVVGVLASESAYAGRVGGLQPQVVPAGRVWGLQPQVVVRLPQVVGLQPQVVQPQVVRREASAPHIFTCGQSMSADRIQKKMLINQMHDAIQANNIQEIKRICNTPGFDLKGQILPEYTALKYATSVACQKHTNFAQCGDRTNIHHIRPVVPLLHLYRWSYVESYV